MIGLATLLAAVGLADLVRRGSLVAGGLVSVVLPLLLGAAWHTLWLAPLVVAVTAAWLAASAHRSRLGTVTLAAAAVLLLLLSPGLDGRDSPLDGWYRALPVPGLVGVPIERAALAVGVLLFLTTAANVVVRQALVAVGPTLLAQEQTIEGGRLLGPLERWLVFAFAVGGHLGALGALVAAKGILRFPEISRDRPDGSRAEYVLVGSFVSWTLALVTVPLF
jgi:hypothetical protein